MKILALVVLNCALLKKYDSNLTKCFGFQKIGTVKLFFYDSLIETKFDDWNCT
jgi:hypothetical protein